VYKIIHQMTAQDLLKITKIGNAKSCSLNLKSPTLTNYLSMIASEEAERIPGNLKNKLSEFVARILKSTEANVHAVVLFGSYTKGKETKKSDVDLLIIVPKKEMYDKAIHKESNSWEMRYPIELNTVITEPYIWQRMVSDKKFNISREILKDGIPLHGSQKYWELTLEGLT